jgi:radical SAM protein with 4Fe4S-binding SPASM domain
MKAEIKPRINLEGRTELEKVIPLMTPFIINVDPSSACNFGCTFCPTGDRDLIHGTGRYQGVMPIELFQKIIDDLGDFDESIKVLRLYKDGEPLVNKRLADMIAYAKQSGHVEYIDTTTNGSLMTPERMGPVLEAGLDKVNVSIYGMNRDQYKSFTGFNFDFEKFVENITWLADNKGDCEVAVKVPSELITDKQKEEFYETFGNLSDRIFIENFMECWPDFDVVGRTGATITKGIYQQPPKMVDTCPYIFYSYSINSDGLVSSCFLDWGRKLLIGDVKEDSVKDIWHSDKMNALRRTHLEGKRLDTDTCKSCGQLNFGMPDNIDPYRDELLPKFTEYEKEYTTTSTKFKGLDGTSVINWVKAKK